MANSLGTLNSALIIQRALALVFTKRPILKRFTMDLSSDQVLYNQQVISRLKTIPSVQTFGSAPSNDVTTDVPVTINQFQQVMYTFQPQEYTATNRDLIDEIAEPMAVAIANYFVDAVAATFTQGANFPDGAAGVNAGTALSNKTTATVANTAYSTLVAIREAMHLRGVPESMQKFALVNAQVYAQLLLDPLCNRAAKVILDDEKNPIVTGELLGVAGFPAISEYPALPTTGNMSGVFGTPDAIVVAARVPKDPRSLLPGTNAPFNLDIITDPGSKFSVMVQEWIGTDLTANVRACWMWGNAVGNTNNAQFLCTQ